MPPKLTVLNFSGGVQSSAMLWMVLLDKIPVPENFVVINADPGMENSETYKYVDMMFEHCRKKDIYCKTVPGVSPNLWEALTDFGDRTRIDNPPFWAKKKDGKLGQLMQKCTRHYKVEPMDRHLRLLLEERHGVSRKSTRIGENIVEKWIGFSSDEALRVKESPRKYIYFRYPLIEMGLDKKAIRQFLMDNDLPIPPRSVCNACFANGTQTFYEMWKNRPEDWENTVKVDDNIRDMSQLGIKEECYVSKTLIPLRDFPEKVFPKLETDAQTKEEQEWNEKFSCDSGYCFT